VRAERRVIPIPEKAFMQEVHKGTYFPVQIEETLMHFFLRNIAATNSHTRHLILGINRYNLRRRLLCRKFIKELISLFLVRLYRFIPRIR